jgi:hypothetical protein
VAPGLGLRRAVVLPLLFLGRVVRFTALAFLGTGLGYNHIP